MEAVCDVLESLLSDASISRYLVALSSFDREKFNGILKRHGLENRWLSWSDALGL
jgi:hypothetical protein